MGNGINGILIINKEPDWTSHDVVARLRTILGTRRIGHGGTLDPMATGVLPIFVGLATRGVQFAEADSKVYVAGLRLGVETDTQDSSGRILRENPRKVTRYELESILPAFTGEIWQIPPMYSAVKVGGKKLYELARKGIEVERKPRKITVSAICILEDLEDGFLLSIECSKGTYIRTICHDIGIALGTYGCMSSLVRVQSGHFHLRDAVTITAVESFAKADKIEELLLPVDKLFYRHPAINIAPAEVRKCRNGASIILEIPDGVYRVYDSDGEFLMLGECRGGIVKSIKTFFSNEPGS